MSISQYAKTAASVSGGVVAWGTAAAALFALVPDKRIAGAVAAILMIVHAAQSFSVWLTKNEPVIDADTSAVQRLVAMIKDWSGTLEELKTAVHQVVSALTGAPAESPVAEPPADRHV